MSNLDQDIAEIKARNARVEEDKAWVRNAGSMPQDLVRIF